MKTGLDYFLDDVRRLTKTKPPYNEAFLSRLLNTLNTAITIIEGLNSIIIKQKREGFIPHVVQKPVVLPKKNHYHASGKSNGLAAYRERTAKTARNEEIIQQFKQGFTKTEIGKKHQISQSRVFSILKRAGL
jgi:DNA-binding CsgD family transcriptional regulator